MTIVGTWEWPPGRARGAQSSPGHFLTEKGRGRSAFVWEREPGTVAVPTALPSPLPLSPQRFYFYFGKCKKTRLSYGGWKFTEGPGCAEYPAVLLSAKKGEWGALLTHLLRRISQA